MTMNGVMALLICVISPNSVASGAHFVKVVEDIPKLSATEMKPKTSSFSAMTYDDIIFGTLPSRGLNARGVA